MEKVGRSGQIQAVTDPDSPPLFIDVFVVPDENPTALRLDRPANPDLQFTIAGLPALSLTRVRLAPDFDHDRTARDERTVDDQTKRAFRRVLAQKHDSAVEVRIDQLR